MSKSIRILLIILMLMICCPLMQDKAYGESNKLTDEFYIIKDTQSQVAPGIIDRRMVINTAEGDQQVILHICYLDMTEESLSMLAGYADYNPEKIGLDTVTNHAKDAEKATGKDVVFAMNSNFFETDGNTPLDILIKDGVIYYGEPGNLFLGLTEDDRTIMGSYGKNDYKLKEAVGGRYYLVKNGNMTCTRGDGKTEDGINTARNAIGVMPDGTVVCFATEGKNSFFSAGIDAYDLTEIMHALGCEDVMLTDGGGSSTYAVQRPGTQKLAVENNPSYGVQRRVSVSLLITSSAQDKVKDNFSKCQKNGHNYIYNSTNIKCKICGIVETSHDFSGLVTDNASGKKMYYINGERQIGWMPLDREVYYFNKIGFSEKVTVKSTKELTCTSNGYTVYRCEKASEDDGKEYKNYIALAAPGHVYDETRSCERCGWKQVSLDECSITTEYKNYIYNGKERKPKVIIKANGKTLNTSCDYKIAGYENNIDYGTGKIYIKTKQYQGANFVENAGSIKAQDEPYVVEFRIVPASVNNLKIKTLGTDSIKLSWKKVQAADGYQISKYDSKTGKYKVWKTINDSNAENYTVKKIATGKVHKFRVAAFVKNDRGEKVLSNYKTISGITKPLKVKNVKLSKAGKSAIKVKWGQRECTGYQIRYSENKNFKSYKQVTVKGKKTVTKTVKNLTKNKKYYIKVRAYTSTGDIRSYGSWSAIKSIK